MQPDSVGSLEPGGALSRSAGPLHAVLVLARVSNLPTVWSNCLVAWLLGGGGSGGRFSLLCLGATLLYTGGMFLNDAVDVEFDRKHRSERPIPSGAISERAAWVLSVLTLLAGWCFLMSLGRAPTAYGLGLLGLIVVYDLVHKRTACGVFLMASCRFLLYVVAASAASGGPNQSVVTHGLALAAYVLGLSWIARAESTRAAFRLWPLGLLFAPVIMALLTQTAPKTGTWVAALVVTCWVLWCVRGVLPGFGSRLRPAVSGLLAGIVLVDSLALSHRGWEWGVAFCGLFLLALGMQRIAPAT